MTTPLVATDPEFLVVAVELGLVLAGVVALAAALVAVGVGFDPLLRAAESAASAALDTGAYVDSVAPAGGAGAEPSVEIEVEGIEVGVGAGGGLPSTEVVEP